MSLSTSWTLKLELEDYCHLQELFWNNTVTVIIVIVRIGRLLSFTRTLLEDHCHCHCYFSATLMSEFEDYCHLQARTLLEDHCHCHHCHCYNWKTAVIYKNSFGRPLSLSSLSLLELKDYCHLQELFWKITVTVIVNLMDSYFRI